MSRTHRAEWTLSKPLSEPETPRVELELCSQCFVRRALNCGLCVGCQVQSLYEHEYQRAN